MFTVANRTFTKVNHIVGLKMSLNKSKGIRISQKTLGEIPKYLETTQTSE